MDAKLAEYRARKRRENAIKSVKDSLRQFSHGLSLTWAGRKKTAMHELTIEDNDDVDNNRPTSPTSSEETVSVDELKVCERIRWANFLLYASLWVILYSLAIYMEFGAVYFVISSLFIIYYNTRTGPKERGELSAYSVFNPNCESIKGTLKAEQFEQELRYGVLHT